MIATMITDKILLEIKPAVLMRNTDAGRINRAKTQVRTNPVNFVKLDDGNWIYEYNFKSYPSTEEKRHWGYVIVDGGTKREILECFCDCKDWHFRQRYVMKKAKLFDDKNMPIKYKNRVPAAVVNKPPVKTNPMGIKYFCKHQYALMPYVTGKRI
jgi:hypothetical protein